VPDGGVRDGLSRRDLGGGVGGTAAVRQAGVVTNEPKVPSPQAATRCRRPRPGLQLDTALGYFENNAPRMRYKWFRSRGLFVGSGVVEAGYKSVIGQRLKSSGMRWTVTGAIIALRRKEASSIWEAICCRPRTQTRTP
jgi:hypothetical protein